MTQNSPHANSIPEEWLSAYLDDELSSEQRQLVEAAVKEQPQLAQLLDELTATRRLIQQLPVFPTSSTRRSLSNTKSEVSDLDDGLDSDELISSDDSTNSNSLASANDRQLQQRLADDRPSMDLAPSDATESSSRLSWRMLALAASLFGVAALGATMWYQSDRWNKLAFDTSSDNRASESAKTPEGLVDSDSGPKAFGSVENLVAPMAPATDAPGMERSATEGGMGGATGSGQSGQEFGSGGLGGGGLGGGGLGGGGFSGGLGGGAGAAPELSAAGGMGGRGGGRSGSPVGNSMIGGPAGAAVGSSTDPNQNFDLAPQSNGQLSQKEAFSLLHEEAKTLNAPTMSTELQAQKLDKLVKPDSSAGQSRPSGDNQFGASIASASPAIVSPSKTSPAPSDLAMEFRTLPKQADPAAPVAPSNVEPPSIAAPSSIASPGAPSPAALVPTDPAMKNHAIDPAPVASSKSTLEQLLNSGQSVESLPSPAASNARAMQGMKLKDKSRSLPEIEPARKAEATRGLDAANSPLSAPSSVAQPAETAQTDAAKKNLPPKSQEKNQVLIPKSALHRSSAWSEAAVTAQLDGNPLYRPMLSLLGDANQDRSRKLHADSKGTQADESVLTAVVRLTADQRAAVIEQSKQLGVKPAVKDDGQTAWVLFLNASELDRLLESANQKEKLNIFWISPAKQSATIDRRVLIVNPY